MSTREQLQNAIPAAIEQAVRTGSVLDVNALALRLSSTYQQSGLTIGAICDEIRFHLARATGDQLRRDLA